MLVIILISKVTSTTPLAENALKLDKISCENSSGEPSGICRPVVVKLILPCSSIKAIVFITPGCGYESSTS